MDPPENVIKQRKAKHEIFKSASANRITELGTHNVKLFCKIFFFHDCISYFVAFIVKKNTGVISNDFS